MKKRKVGEINTEGENKAEFYLTDVTLVYPDKEPRSINYVDVHYLQEMFVEEKKKYILGVYTKEASANKIRSLTFGDFTDTKGFLEAFHSVKNAIHTFEHELIGFFGNLLVQKQKPKRCELGMDHKHILIRAVEDDQTQFFRIEVNSCKVEEIQNQNIIKINLLQSQLEIINFARKEDVLTFKKLMYKAMEEAAKGHAVIYDEIEDVDKFKIYILENSPYLKSLHEKLVISGAMPEHEFWESRSEFQEYKKYYTENKQKLSKSTGLFIKDKITSETEKQRILTQYPEVKGPYLLEVMDGSDFNFEKDKKFWEEFIKLQKKKDTVIVGGKNPVAIPTSQSNLFQYGDAGKKVDLSEVPLGDVDLCRNLDMKTNVAEKLMHETLKEHYGDYEPGKNDIENMIKRFQVHGLNILGGIKPTSNLQTTSIQDMIDEFKDLMPEHLELPIEMQIKAVKMSQEEGQAANKDAANGKMLIEEFSRSSQGPDLKNAKANSDAITSKLQRLLESKKQGKQETKLDSSKGADKDKKVGIFHRPDMQLVFKELVSASLQKEEAVEFNQFRETYEAYHEQAKDLLKLFNSIGSSDDLNNENKRKTMKNLINELIGKINLYLGDLDKDLKRQINPAAPDKTKEHSKIAKLMETILEQLKFALNPKD